MKKNLLFILLSFMTLTLNAQLLVPDDMSGSFAPEVQDYKFDISLENSSSESVDVYWELILEEGFPSPSALGETDGWLSAICDNNLCYLPSKRNCPVNSVNTFAAGESRVWNLHIYGNGVEGTGAVRVRLHYPQESGDSISVDHVISFMSGSTSVIDLNLGEIAIYPNPASDMFRIKDDEGIARVGVYNVVGKKIMDVQHTRGQAHDISSLSKGMYLVRIMDNAGKVVKTMKLSKNASGV